MAYIESHQSLLSHPKTRRLARSLNMPAVHVMGHLHALWHWALDYADDGDLSRFDATDIADAAAWEGDPETWMLALLECGVGGGAGFLDSTDDGGVVIHDWWDYAGKLVERRKANAERMRNARAEHDKATAETRAEHVQRTSSARAGANVPNPTVAKQNEPTVAVANATTGARARVRAVPKPAKAREQNPTWDALAATCGKPATRNERSDFGDTVAQLREVDATPEQIAGFPFWWRSEHPNATMTHRCYRDHWGRYINAPPKTPPQLSDIKSPMMRAIMTAPLEADDAERDYLPTQNGRHEVIPAHPRGIGSGEHPSRAGLSPRAAGSG